MEVITAFRSSDGKLFTTRAECAEYEAQLMWEETVNKFIKSELNSYQAHAQVSIVRKTIIAWEKYKGMQLIDVLNDVICGGLEEVRET